MGEPTGAGSFALPLRYPQICWGNQVGAGNPLGKLKGALKGKARAAHRRHIVRGILDKVGLGGTRKEDIE